MIKDSHLSKTIITAREDSQSGDYMEETLVQKRVKRWNKIFYLAIKNEYVSEKLDTFVQRYQN